MNFFMNPTASLRLQRLSRLRWGRRLQALGTGVVIGRVKLIAPQKLRIGANSIIDDGVILNADGSETSSIVLGARTVIREYAILEAHKGRITLDDDVFIGAHCSIYGQGSITIGAGSLIATGTSIISSNHSYADPDRPYADQGESALGVVISPNCWIGANCTILDGVVLGNNSVVAAGAVVNRSFEGNVVLGGVPARILKKFDPDSREWRKP